jgi:hypothetical protein
LSPDIHTAGHHSLMLPSAERPVPPDWPSSVAMNVSPSYEFTFPVSRHSSPLISSTFPSLPTHNPPACSPAPLSPNRTPVLIKELLHTPTRNIYSKYYLVATEPPQPQQNSLIRSNLRALWATFCLQPKIIQRRQHKIKQFIPFSPLIVNFLIVQKAYPRL